MAWEEERDERGRCCGGLRTERRREMRRGDAQTFAFQVVQNAQTLQYGTVWPGEAMPANCQPVNLTGWRVWFTAKYEVADPDNQAVIQLDSTMAFGGVTIVTPAQGTCTATVSGLSTSQLPDGPVHLAYDVKAEDASQNGHTCESGRLTVVPNVTRST